MSDFRELSRSVAGLRVLVTGGASGMGRATARVFAAEGAIVAVTDFNGEGAEAVAKELRDKGQKATAWRLDVANADEIKSVVVDIAASSAASTSSSTMPASPADRRLTVKATRRCGRRTSPCF